MKLLDKVSHDTKLIDWILMWLCIRYLFALCFNIVKQGILIFMCNPREGATSIHSILHCA